MAEHQGDQPRRCVASSPDGTYHVLVVNDTQEILQLFREILEDEGYRTTLLSYAPNELTSIEESGPDLIILDLMIQGEADGWNLLQKLRMNRPTSHIPVLVCTAAVQLVRELEGHLAVKNVRVLLKPFDIDDLLEILADMRESVSLAVAGDGSEGED